MEFQISLITDRLLLENITLNDNKFIFELVNSNGWLKFIGNRNVNSTIEATAYIQKIIDSSNLYYWIVKLKDSKIAIGIITFIKRDYLEYHDIGFAFLPNFSNKGYAYEATFAVLNSVIQTHNLSYILATTIPENITSIKLLKKLGLNFEKEIESDNVRICVYGVSIDKLQINEISKSFFGLFSNINNRQPNINLLNSICIPEIMIISKVDNKHTIYNLDSFIEPRQKMLTDGTLTEFEECEINEQTKICNNIAQRYSEYLKNGILERKSFNKKGHKFLQFVKTNKEWKISSVIWEDENSQSVIM